VTREVGGNDIAGTALTAVRDLNWLGNDAV
jgi:hypothetical protein